MYQLSQNQQASISIHAPTRGATYRQNQSQIRQRISIHAPTRGATVSVPSAVAFSVFQSTLPREERHHSDSNSDDACAISIHAPTRGATITILLKASILLFQSTLPREERRQKALIIYRSSHFNPRSHERSDSNIAQKICLFLYNTDNKYIIR